MRNEARQTAAGVSNRYMSHREDYTNAVADAVAVAVLRKARQRLTMGANVRYSTPEAVIDEMLAEFSPSSPSPQRQEGWQPIATAPKDGTRIQLFTPHRGIGIAIAWWRPMLKRWESEYVIDKPTHWMPLPALPTQDKEPT